MAISKMLSRSTSNVELPTCDPVTREDEKDGEGTDGLEYEFQILLRSVKRMKRQLHVMGWFLGFVTVFATIVTWSIIWSPSDGEVLREQQQSSPVPLSEC